MSDELLRADVLDGVRVVVAGCAGGELGDAVKLRCSRLGASVRGVGLQDLGEEAIAEAVAASVAELGAVDALVNDAASVFAAAGGGTAALRACLDRCWIATAALANAALIGGEGGAGGGRIVNLAPRADAGEHAGAARAGLENLARTLSIEWARHAIVTTTVAPGQRTGTDTLAQLVAFLLSPAGGYYSGCLFTLA